MANPGNYFPTHLAEVIRQTTGTADNILHGNGFGLHLKAGQRPLGLYFRSRDLPETNQNNLIKPPTGIEPIKIKLGRMLKMLAPKLNELQLRDAAESLTYAAENYKPVDEYQLLLATGLDVRRAYDESNYGPGRNSTLHNSCMRYKTSHTRLYEINPDSIRVATLIERATGKVVARCLVWPKAIILQQGYENFKPLDVTVMDNNAVMIDRVYFITSSHERELLKRIESHYEGRNVINRKHGIVAAYNGYHLICATFIEAPLQYQGWPYLDTLSHIMTTSDGRVILSSHDLCEQRFRNLHNELLGTATLEQSDPIHLTQGMDPEYRYIDNGPYVKMRACDSCERPCEAHWLYNYDVKDENTGYIAIKVCYSCCTTQATQWRKRKLAAPVSPQNSST